MNGKSESEPRSVMNLVQANRLMKLANFLTDLPEEKFDFSQIRVIKQLDEDNKNLYDIEIDPTKMETLTVPVKCGTVACALGWCPSVFKEFTVDNPCVSVQDIVDSGEIGIDVLFNGEDATESLPIDPKDYWGDSEYKAAKFFGLSDDDYEDLFLNYSAYGDGPVTKKMVVNKIHKIVREAGYNIV